MNAVWSAGSMRITIPASWVKQEGIKNKSKLVMLESGGLLILPPRSMSRSEMEKMNADLTMLIELEMRKRGIRP